MGKAEEVEALELAVNRAAEQAVPQAKTLLTNAVKSMNVDDAKQILRGGDDSVTQFFKSKTAPQLSERFLPIVRQVTQRSGLAQQYNALAGQGAALGLVKPEQATVERYVTQKALDGLYTMIAEEEKKDSRQSAGSRQRHHSPRVRSSLTSDELLADEIGA